ncbi:prepilin peptidase [Nanoarchaeota archaeon]
MFEVIVLIGLALIWMIFATMQDIKTREVANWINFSLIIFALGFRFFYSLFQSDGFNFFFQGLIGFVIFFIMGNLFYYSKVFGGGDAKLMYALGAILPFSASFIVNLQILISFLFLFLFTGGIYGVITSIFLGLKNSKIIKSNFSKLLKKYKRISLFVMLIGLVIMVLGYRENVIFYYGILVFIIPYIFLYVKSIDKIMFKKIDTNKLTEGDLLTKDLKIGGKTIKMVWGGLTKAQIKEIKKRYRKIEVKWGIAFVPVFLISFLILLYAYFSGFLEILWNSLW